MRPALVVLLLFVAFFVFAAGVALGTYLENVAWKSARRAAKQHGREWFMPFDYVPLHPEDE